MWMNTGDLVQHQRDRSMTGVVTSVGFDSSGGREVVVYWNNVQQTHPDYPDGHNIEKVLVEEPVDVGSPVGWSNRNLLIADLLVDAHTTDRVLTILSEFKLI